MPTPPLHHDAVPSDMPSPAAPSPATDEAGFGLALADIQRALEAGLDGVLADPPGDVDDLKDLLAQALGLSPAPEVVEALEYIGEGWNEPHGPRHLVRRLVVMRLLADRVLRDLNRSCRIEPGAIAFAAASLDALVEDATMLRQQCGFISMELPRVEIQRLDRMQRHLLPASDRIGSYALLLDLLDRLTQGVVDRDPATVGRLTREEIELVETALAGQRPSSEPLDRALLDAAALRCAMREDLDDIAAESAASDEPAGEEGARAASSRAAMARARTHLAVYSLVLERLQYLQGKAVAAGDRKASARLLATQKALFPVYTSLAATVSRSQSSTPEPAGRASARQRRELFRQAELAEREARPAETRESICLDALKEMRDAEKAPSRMPVRLEAVFAKEEQEAPRTRRTLAMTAVGLLVASIGINGFFLFRRATPPPSRGLAHFAPALPIDQKVDVGPIMFAQVPGNYWDILEPGDRAKGLEELGKRAASSGFAALVLASENGSELGFWRPVQGPTPLDPAPGAASSRSRVTASPEETADVVPASGEQPAATPSEIPAEVVPLQ